MLKLSNTTSCLSARACPQFHFRGMKVERKLAADTSNHPQPWKLYPLLQSTIISSVIDTSRTLVSFKAEEKSWKCNQETNRLQCTLWNGI